MTTGPEPLRIGTAERTAAMQALDVHLEAGRLGVEEYADRSALAANAVVASDLAALFADLPAPHPPLPGDGAALPPTAQMPVVPESAAVAPRSGGFLEVWGPRILAVTPIVALALFFTTGLWYWFLLIPAVGALVYGTDRGHRRHGGHGLH